MEGGKRKGGIVMEKQEREKAAAVNEELKRLLLRHLEQPAIRPTAVAGLTLVRREAANSSERCFEKPLASILVQGNKHTVIGTHAFSIAAKQCLVSGVDMPSTSYVVDPTPEKPFLALFFYLDRQLITDLAMEMEQDLPPSGEDSLGVAVADAEPDLLEGAVRLVKLLDKPEQIPMRAPMIMRELHYLLLAGPQGGILRRLHTLGTQNNQIVQAISLLRRNVTATVRMDDLARRADVVVDALGGLRDRRAVQEAAAKAGVPLVSAGISGLTGWVAVVRPGENGPAAYLGAGDEHGGGVEETEGNLAPTAALAAALQASEVLKVLTGRPHQKGLLLFDLAENLFTPLEWAR